MNEHEAISREAGEGVAGVGVPDPGSRRAGWVTLLVLVPVLAVVVGLQQFSVVSASRAARESAQTIVPSGRADTFGLMSRLSVRFHHALVGVDPAKGAGVLEKAGYLESLDTWAASPHERMRAAIVAAELVDADEALARLDAEAVWLDEIDAAMDEAYARDLRTDLELLRRVYLGEELAQADRERLIAHHGWHGELALSYGLDDEDPRREPLIDGGLVLMAGLVGFGALAVAALVAGVVLFVVLCVKLGTGSLRMRFVRPARGGSVYLETFAVFVGLFLVLQVASAWLEGRVPEAGLYGLQWVVLLAIFWPLVRGVNVARWRSDMGLVAPEGIFREIGAGLVVYLAALPVYVVAALVSLGLVIVRGMVTQSMAGGEEVVAEPPMSNPVFEMLEASDLVTMVVLGTLVTVWAPLVEEGVMRGALYRHLRGRFGFVVSAVVSALLFGALHQYDVLMLLPVVSLGVMFAFVREWRGSLVGCIAAHAAHNTSIFLLVGWLISAT